ncbi:hypothetical protein ENBRE01_3200 [Enteropsectra breve]|nr:hypothetical protein ENBRE01_3200 [Enteropsectra breve]
MNFNLISRESNKILIIGNYFLQKHQSILDLHKQLLVLKPNDANKENVHNQIEFLLSNYIRTRSQHNKSTTLSDIQHRINIPQNTNLSLDVTTIWIEIVTQQV